jgi:peptidyl-prolyl cis-trans isomerase B (cyclophilin B)
MTQAILSTRHGDITVEFLPEVAPNHVNNFIELARSGFYDGTKFHRVIPGFMIQGGDPNSKQDDRRLHGTGGSGKNVKAEFSKTPHTRGVLSAARSANPDSASSQFFIMVADAPHLDGQYSAFGKVVSGIEVVDKIVAEDTDHRDNPLEAVSMTVKVVD